MSTFQNASPQSIPLGIEDLSTVELRPTTQKVPQHLAKVYMFAKRGTTVPQLTAGGPMLLQYGADTFDPNLPYFNHATRFATGFVGAGSAIMAQRVVPTDAGPEANMIIYADIIEDDIPNYIRNSAGQLVKDATTNQYKVDPTTPTITGYRVKYIKEYASKASCCPLADGKLEDIGTAVSKTGTMISSLTGATSTMYPIIELRAKYKGADYNNIGIMVSSILSDALDSRVVDGLNGLPYELQLVQRKSAADKYQIEQTLAGTPSATISFQNKAVNPVTKARMDIETVMQQQWFNETDPLLPLKYEDYQHIYIYRDNLKIVTDALLALEDAALVDNSVIWDDGLTASPLSWYDYPDADLVAGEYGNRMNIFTGKSSSQVKYLTFLMDETTPNFANDRQSEVKLNGSAPIFLSGGGDGTLSNGMFESVVNTELQKYLDPDSEVMDTAISVESVMYDSGFGLETKKEICNIIAVRKDTAAALCTTEAIMGETVTSIVDQRAIASLLTAKLALAPESVAYGTEVARAIIVAGTGLATDNSTTDRIPQLYSIAIKSARYMGAASGEWNSTAAFDRAPGNIITELKDLEPKFIPAGFKPTLWNESINWSQPYDREQYHFPALQTVYSNDTSVLNSWTTVIAAAYLTKIANDAWRIFTGATDLSEAQLASNIVDYVNGRTQGIFDGRITVIPEVQFTAADKARGYSWRLINKMYASNMKTVQVYTTAVYRAGDL